MTNPFVKWSNKLKELWEKGTLSQRILAIGVLLSLTLVFILLLYWLNREEYAVLYSKLSEDDSASVVSYLKQKKIKFKLADGGTTILVPKDKVYEIRLEIAGQDIIGKGNVGFELFSKSSLGQTEFTEQINYMRALQGELAKTISALPVVKAARVHLVLPKRSLFVEERTPASASILVELKRGRELTKEQIKSIVNLVATAVEGLDTKHITLIDNEGHLLYRPSTGNELGLSSSQLEYKMNLEKTLSDRIQNLLMPVIGPGKVIAKVNVDLDLSQKKIYKEVYDPNQTAIRSEQKITETSRGTAQAQSTTAGVKYQGAGPGTTTTQQSQRNQKTVNYEVSKEEQTVLVPRGEISHLTVAVLVDGTYKVKNGKRVYIPRSQKELAQIKELVKNAVGFDPKRGDTIEVTSMQFSPVEIPGPSFWQVLLDYLQKFLTPILNSVVILLFLLLVVRPVVLSIIKPTVEEEEAEVEELPEAEEPTEPQLTEEELAALEAKKPFEELKQKVATILDKHPDEAILIIKNWMREEVRK